MRLQLLSDLHLESEAFDPEPAPGADLLVLAGDIDSTWAGYARFAGWPVPVVVVAGNHEFDGRDLDTAWGGLRRVCERHGLRLLQREAWLFEAPDGERVRLLGCTRWSDFDLYGPGGRARAMRAARHFTTLMRASRAGAPFDARAIRAEGLACRAWLAAALAEPADGRWQRTVVVTHFGCSVRSIDPRFGGQPSSASFCNADDELIAQCDLWLHGHLHCRHDYLVERAGRPPARVVCNARGIAAKGESEGHDPLRAVEAGPAGAHER